MKEITSTITKPLAVLGENGKGYTKEANFVSWNGNAAKLDIREWHPKPSLPTHVFAKTDCGLRRNSIILMEQLSTIDQFKLTQRIGALDENTMKEVNNALAVSVGIV